MIALKSDFIHSFNDFIHVYSPRARAENPLAQTFDVNRKPVSLIHVIFSWAQIGRSAIFGREIGVPDREIFSRQKKKSLMSKIVYLHQRRSL